MILIDQREKRKLQSKSSCRDDLRKKRWRVMIKYYDALFNYLGNIRQLTYEESKLWKQAKQVIFDEMKAGKDEWDVWAENFEDTPVIVSEDGMMHKKYLGEFVYENGKFKGVINVR